MKRNLSRLLAVLSIAAGGTFAIASPASADYRRCQNTMCLFTDEEGKGLVFYLRTDDSTLHNNPCQYCRSSKHPESDDTWGDQTSSYANESDRVYCLYMDTGFNGKSIPIQPGETGNLTGRLNDEISSARPCP